VVLDDDKVVFVHRQCMREYSQLPMKGPAIHKAGFIRLRSLHSNPADTQPIAEISTKSLCRHCAKLVQV
jgi:hypothetical protein